MIYSYAALILSLIVFLVYFVLLFFNKKQFISKSYITLFIIAALVFITSIILNSVSLFLENELDMKSRFAILSGFIFPTIFFFLECLFCILVFLQRKISKIESIEEHI